MAINWKTTKRDYSNVQVDDTMEDNQGESQETSGGNTGLPFGLCKKYGINVPQGATPRDAWNLLAGRGIYPPWTEQGKDQYNQESRKKDDSENTNNSEYTKEVGRVFESLKNLKIDYHEVKRLNKNLTSDEIVTKVAGGDLTGGSCVSAALCYIANKEGFDALDFRGGESRVYFSHKWDEIAAIPELKTIEKKDTNDYNAVKRLVEHIVPNREYLLITGKHCSVVRKQEGQGLQYLELQSARENGFKQLTMKVLKDRFRCQKTHSTYGYAYKTSSQLIDLDNFKALKEFSSIMGYINTPIDKQQKGSNGYEK